MKPCPFRYRLVTPEQLRDGWLELVGTTTRHRTYTVVQKHANGLYTVRVPTTEAPVDATPPGEAPPFFVLVSKEEFRHGWVKRFEDRLYRFDYTVIEHLGNEGYIVRNPDVQWEEEKAAILEERNR